MDDTVTIATGADTDSCWEQAIYPVSSVHRQNHLGKCCLIIIITFLVDILLKELNMAMSCYNTIGGRSLFNTGIFFTGLHHCHCLLIEEFHLSVLPSTIYIERESVFEKSAGDIEVKLQQTNRQGQNSKPILIQGIKKDFSIINYGRLFSCCQKHKCISIVGHKHKL